IRKRVRLGVSSRSGSGVRPGYRVRLGVRSGSGVRTRSASGVIYKDHESNHGLNQESDQDQESDWESDQESDQDQESDWESDQESDQLAVVLWYSGDEAEWSSACEQSSRSVYVPVMTVITSCVVTRRMK
ncbi:uncharacterized, partial [Tachysurus ichikawai]